MLIQAQDRTGSNRQVNYDRHPDYCPICRRGVSPIETSQRWLIIEKRLEIVFRCPTLECEHHFIARYGYKRVGATEVYYLSEVVPLTIATSNFTKIITDISQNFVDVYRQAEEAELRGLKLICGPGYRKALEFLIKDYVVGLNTDKAEEIKKLNLSTCISNHVNDRNVKEVAKRAVWLGNDETHYLRKWDDKDLKDLKILIGLTVRWVETEKMTEEAIKDMPDKKS